MNEECFTIEFIDKVHFNELKKDWTRLEKGKEMTIFQSFNWYKMLVDNSIPKDTSFFESIFAVVRSARDNLAVLIVPIWVVKHRFKIVNKKCVYFIDREGWSDYLNCIYIDFNSLAFDFLLKSLSEKYKVNSFMFEMLKESTSIYDYICNNKTVILDESKIYVTLNVPNNSKIYSENLSKNTRQNIRTANNRIKKDCHSISFNFVDESTSRVKCMQMRQDMFSQKYAKVSRLRKYKYRLVNLLRYHYPKCNPIIDFKDCKVMTAYVDDDLAAFFAIYWTKTNILL